MYLKTLKFRLKDLPETLICTVPARNLHTPHNKLAYNIIQDILIDMFVNNTFFLIGNHCLSSEEEMLQLLCPNLSRLLYCLILNLTFTINNFTFTFINVVIAQFSSSHHFRVSQNGCVCNISIKQ